MPQNRKFASVTSTTAAPPGRARGGSTVPRIRVPPTADSDFTRLAARIREQGVDVFGFGERKTPESFRQACRRFIYSENLLPCTLATDVRGEAIVRPDLGHDGQDRTATSRQLVAIKISRGNREWPSAPPAGPVAAAVPRLFPFWCGRAACQVEHIGIVATRA